MELIYLWLLNVLGGLAYLGLAVGAILCVYLIDDINTKVPFMHFPSIWVDCQKLTHETIYTDLDVETKVDIRAHCIQFANNTMSYYKADTFEGDLLWPVVVFLAWTGIAHLMYASVWRTYIKDINNTRGTPYYRWLEYAFSAGIMMFIIYYRIGDTHIENCIQASAYVFFSIYLGFIYKRSINRKDEYCVKNGELFYSVLIYVLLWGSIFFKFFYYNMDVLSDVPWFVYVIVFGEFGLYSVFIIFYMAEINMLKSESQTRESLIKFEVAYTLNSLTSKLLLSVLVTFQSLF